MFNKNARIESNLTVKVWLICLQNFLLKKVIIKREYVFSILKYTYLFVLSILPFEANSQIDANLFVRPSKAIYFATKLDSKELSPDGETSIQNREKNTTGPVIVPSDLELVSQVVFQTTTMFDKNLDKIKNRREFYNEWINFNKTPAKSFTEEDYSSVDKQYSWALEYLFMRARPKFGVINKWISPITIAIGWPKNDSNNQENVTVGNEMEHAVKNLFKDKYNIIEDEASLLIPELEKLTGLTIKFQKTTEFKDRANLRIIPIDVSGVRTKKALMELQPNDPIISNLQINSDPTTKIDRRFSVHGNFALPATDYRFWWAVPFTPTFADQVDGYLLTKADNSIGMAFCYVDSSKEDVLLKNLVRECLIRSLGIPNAFENHLNKSDLLGNWNSLESSKPRLNRPLINLSEEDKKIISILYCEELKVGSDRFEFVHSVMSSPECSKQN